MLRRLLPSALVFLVIISAASAGAHPHVWVDCSLTAEFDSKGFAGFRHVWTFDAMFSVTMIDEFDVDGNRSFDEQEVRAVKANAFDNLKNFNYFTDIRIDGTPFEVQFVKDFRSRVDATGKLVYEFFVPCHVTAIKTPKTIVIAVYDQSYYTDLGYTDDSPQWAGQTSGMILKSNPVELTDTFFETIMYSPKGFEILFQKK